MLILFLHIIFAGDLAEQCALTGATARIKLMGSYLMELYAWRCPNCCHILPKLHPLQTKRFKNSFLHIICGKESLFILFQEISADVSISIPGNPQRLQRPENERGSGKVIGKTES